MKKINEQLPTILPDHVVRMVARDGWRRQAIADAELEKKLAVFRSGGISPGPADVTSLPRVVSQQDLFSSSGGGSDAA